MTAEEIRNGFKLMTEGIGRERWSPNLNEQFHALAREQCAQLAEVNARLDKFYEQIAALRHDLGPVIAKLSKGFF